ncbi:MAG TPA: hypothetical protein PLY87_18385 [Planctomycetaceae bacterium]|nr:hypothetical protein [Planctomycetaceae bacterium]
MQLTVEELRAVEAGQPLRCVIAGTDLKCVVMRDDVFANLQLPVEVVDNDVLDDLYLALIADSPNDWKTPEEWAVGEPES